MQAREHTVKPFLSGHSKIDKTKVLKTNGSLMKVESIAESSLCWSILQYFRPALSDNPSWKPIFGLLLSGCLRQVLLYIWGMYIIWKVTNVENKIWDCKMNRLDRVVYCETGLRMNLIEKILL